MGILDLFSGKPKRFVTPGAFAGNRAKQADMTPRTMEQLRSHGVTPDRALALEYFFYTNAPDKAAGLAEALGREGYADVRRGPTRADPRLHAVTGWTPAMAMDDATVAAWTDRMCALGFEHDCEFDGWGTDPGQ